MITIEMGDGSVKKFNLPPEKEHKFVALFEETKNKTVRLTTSDGETIDIKLYDIADCYLGEIEAPLRASNPMPDFFKDFIKNKGF